MAKYSQTAIRQLCRRLEVDDGFFMQCIEESVIEIRERTDRLDLDNGTVLRLRRLQRLCETFDVDVPIAQHLLALTRRIAELEKTLERLKTRETSTRV